jgi:hypothetical protein
MALTIDWATKVISVPKADMTQVQTSPFEVRELDIDVFRLELKDIEDSIYGIVNLITHNHVAPITVGGVTLGRVIEIINGYTVTFENGSYAVNIVGGNSNIGDVVNLNTVSVRSANSAGFIQITSGSGVVPQDIVDIADAVWDEALTKADHNVTNSAGKILRQIKGTVSVEGQVSDVSATTTVFVTDLTQATNDFYANQTVVFTSGNLEGQARIITSYNGGTKTITLDSSEPLTAAPDDASDFTIIANHVHPVSEIAAEVDKTALKFIDLVKAKEV